jgi:hypothetical protein
VKLGDNKGRDDLDQSDRVVVIFVLELSTDTEREARRAASATCLQLGVRGSGTRARPEVTTAIARRLGFVVELERLMNEMGGCKVVHEHLGVWSLDIDVGGLRRTE